METRILAREKRWQAMADVVVIDFGRSFLNFTNGTPSHGS